jgi:hypothetical protein
MAFRSYFSLVKIAAHFGDNADDIDTDLPFVGDERSITFTIDGYPHSGYLLLNTYDVDNSHHRVQINGTDLPDSDLVRNSGANRWQTRMDTIPNGILVNGENTLTILRAEGRDNFLVDRVVVHWRESD